MASTGVSLDSVGTTPSLPPLLTPIVTANRADYTSITDDIDTSSAAYHSPRGSPTTPYPCNLGVDVNLDTYTKKEQKKPQSRKLSPHRVAVRSEAAQLKHAEESEHELMEIMIRKRMRQISLTESDSMSEIAKQVISEMERTMEMLEGQGNGYHSDQEKRGSVGERGGGTEPVQNGSVSGIKATNSDPCLVKEKSI